MKRHLCYLNSENSYFKRQTMVAFFLYKPVWQSCAVAKSRNFWRAKTQSNLTDRMEDCSICQSAVVWVRKPNFGSLCCGQPFVCQVWLSSGRLEFVTFSYWLWDWLIERKFWTILNSTLPFDSNETQLHFIGYTVYLLRSNGTPQFSLLLKRDHSL